MCDTLGGFIICNLYNHFFTAVITIFLTLYFSRKYGLSDKDRSIVEKQFQIYNALYLNISKDSLGKPINSNLSFLYFLAAEVLHVYFKNLHSLSCMGNFLIN